MTIRSDSRMRNGAAAAGRTTRRRSPCYRHPEEPITGICASCLRERLSGLDASANPCSQELRRCRSVASASKREASSSSSHEPRRKSCDVFSARSSVYTLFDVDDLKSGSETEAKVESKNVGLSSVAYTVIESEKRNQDRIRVSDDGFGDLDADCADSDDEVEEGEFKLMKEHIDLEFGNKSKKKTKDLRDIAGNIFGAASVFSKKLRKWRQRNSKTKENKSITKNNVVACNNEIVGRRRSCDIEPRFSVDGGRISSEEPRASWDGYMIARTIPTLTPMFSIVENGILGDRRLSVDGPMNSILEDESSSGASASGHSNSDSSSSMRQSSFDRSSSVRSFGKKGECDAVSPANAKVVITEKELEDWHMSSNSDDRYEKLGSTSKKSVRWRKVCIVLGFRNKNREIVGDDWKLARSGGVVASRKSCDVGGSYCSRRSVDNAGGFTGDFKLERNRSGKFSSVDFDSGVTPFYMKPLRSSKQGKLTLH